MTENLIVGDLLVSRFIEGVPLVCPSDPELNFAFMYTIAECHSATRAYKSGNGVLHVGRPTESADCTCVFLNSNNFRYLNYVIEKL
jgi:hypothetical protein